MGIDRQRIVDNFYPARLRGRRLLHAVRRSRSPARATTYYDFDPAAAKALLAEGLGEEASTRDLRAPRSRSGPRSAATSPTRRPSRRRSPPSSRQNLGITVTLDLQESGTYLDNNARRQARRSVHARLGRGLPGRQQLPRLPLRPGLRHQVRYALPGPRRRRQGGRPVVRRRGPRSRPTPRPTTSSSSTSPRSFIAHGGSGTAFKADVEGAHSSPLLERGLLGHEGRRPRHPRVHAERRAAQPLLRATRPTARRCASASRSRSRCTATVGDTGSTRCPSLATGCTANDDLTVWTCTLRDGVTFQDGSDPRCQRRHRVVRSPVGRPQPAPRRSHRCVRVLAGAHRAAASSTRPPVRPAQSTACPTIREGADVAGSRRRRRVGALRHPGTALSRA